MGWEDLRPDGETRDGTISADTILYVLAAQLPDWLYCPKCGYNEIEMAEVQCKLVCPRCGNTRRIDSMKENAGRGGSH